MDPVMSGPNGDADTEASNSRHEELNKKLRSTVQEVREVADEEQQERDFIRKTAQDYVASVESATSEATRNMKLSQSSKRKEIRSLEKQLMEALEKRDDAEIERLQSMLMELL